MGRAANTLSSVHQSPRGAVSAVGLEDSCSDSGQDDSAWEWIYSSPTIDISSEEHCQDVPSNRRKRGWEEEQQITGARMGSFECRIGDCVTLRAEGSTEAWVAIICEFVENEDGEKAANFMWFTTEKEIHNQRKKRMDFRANELYISPSWDINPLAAIEGKAIIMSLGSFLERHPSGKISRHSPDHGKLFICRRGCDTRTATYTEEFTWEDMYHGDIFELIEFVNDNLKPKTSRPRDPEWTANHGDMPPVSRSRQQLHKSTAWTKQKPPATPTSRKRVLARRQLEFTPLATRQLPQASLQSSPFQLARMQLHVASVPSSLPCRDKEFTLVYSHLEAAIADGSGSCIYIAGTPGTGKTATVREVISRLEDSVQTGDLDDFIFVEINGMKITDPHQSYTLLWEALKGERIGSAQALDLLEHEFKNPSPRRIPCVVLMDELDQLVTRNQSVMYNFFNWPALRHSRLIVLAVANTMDLPERTLSNKISSRIGLTRITFAGYNHEQLMKIIQSRLEGVPGNIVESDAIQFASRKVAAVSGDARRALDICRRAVEIAEAEGGTQNPPHLQKRHNLEETDGSSGRFRNRVTIATIKRAIQEATTNPVQQYLRSLPTGPKLLLMAVGLRTQRNGTQETTFGDVVEELRRIIKLDGGKAQALVLGSLCVSTRRDDTLRDNVDTQTLGALDLQNAAISLAGAGIILLEGQKPERPSKIRLVVGSEEVRMAFRDDLDVKALGLVL